MRVISSSELRSGGGNEIFVLTKKEYQEPDEDLNRAISAQELLVGVEADIREAFRKRHDA